jgi:ribosomal-protein-alanine N-acetyltransferase
MNLSSAQNYEILPAGWRDLKAIHELEQACFERDAYPFLEILGLLSLPGHVCHKVVVDDNVIGFIAGERRAGRGRGWVVTVCVHPQYRRQGIARQLIAVSEEAMGRDLVRLCVRTSNQAAIELYQSAGYLIKETWQRYYNDGENALVMEKKR